MHMYRKASVHFPNCMCSLVVIFHFLLQPSGGMGGRVLGGPTGVAEQLGWGEGHLWGAGQTLLQHVSGSGCHKHYVRLSRGQLE